MRIVAQRTFASLVFSLLAAPHVAAGFVDFNGLGEVNSVPPNIVSDGITLSFTNLVVSETDQRANGFNGAPTGGDNNVQVSDQVNFNGKFLAEPGGFGIARSRGFVRIIHFDADVADLRFYVADIDYGEGITVNAFDGLNNLIVTMSFPSSLGLNGKLQLVDFAGYNTIRKVKLVGNDPIGIDNLSFVAATIDVAIDVKPGSDPNCININGNGVIPVAILGSETLDVSTIDESSLVFGGLEVRVRARKGPMCFLEYSNDDSYLDLVCQFEDEPSYWEPSAESEGELEGIIEGSGTPISGTDSICVVP